MSFGICLLLGIWILYMLLIKGWLWKLLVGLFGWIGMCVALNVYIPASSHHCLTFINHSFSWSEVIPMAIVILATLYTGD